MAETSQSDTRWKSALLVLCGLALAITLFGIADDYGLGGRPWYGWWDANTNPIGSFFVTISKPVAGGASARGGLRDGDIVDIREQSEASRVALLYQLMATQPTTVTVHRGASTSDVRGDGKYDLGGPVRLEACNDRIVHARQACGSSAAPF